MKRQWMVASLLALIGLGPARAIDIDLGNAAAFSAVVFGDVSGMTKVGGRVAVGGNLSLGQATLGAGGPDQSTVPTLLVRGHVLAYSGGALRSGASPGFGLYLGNKAAAVSTALDLRKAASLPLDLDTERIYLSALSEQLRDLPVTGQVQLSSGALTLRGSESALEVFALDAAQVAGTQSVVLEHVAPDAHIVLNLAADAKRRLSLGISTLALSGWRGRVLFNAHDAETLQFGNQTLWGSLLATNACICNSAGRLEGSLVARKWTAAMEIGYTPFIPTP